MNKLTKMAIISVVVTGSFYLIFKAPLPFIESSWNVRCSSGIAPLKIPHRMADRLVMSEVLIGKSAEDVITLLDEPKPSGYFKTYDFVYCLGPQRGLFPMDNEWLVLKLDKNGMVSKAAVVSD